MTANTKRWYESKTIWFNVATFILGGLGALSPETMPQWFPEVMVGVTLIGNVILRRLTREAIV